MVVGTILTLGWIHGPVTGKRKWKWVSNNMNQLEKKKDRLITTFTVNEEKRLIVHFIFTCFFILTVIFFNSGVVVNFVTHRFLAPPLPTLKSQTVILHDTYLHQFSSSAKTSPWISGYKPSVNLSYHLDLTPETNTGHPPQTQPSTNSSREGSWYRL